nr:zinc finger, CCHC-type [Tanacetum cinerariifolium]
MRIQLPYSNTLGDKQVAVKMLSESSSKGYKEFQAKVMAVEDAFLVDNVKGDLCVDYTDAGIVERCNSGSDKDKGKDFKHTLKHGKDDLSLVKHGSHFRIEESLRAQDNDKGKGKDVVGPSVNMIKEGKNKNNKQNKGKKRDLKEHGSGSGSNKNPKLEYSGATTHVCKDRCWFKIYKWVDDRSVLYVSDDHFAPVYGEGSVALEFSFGKTITLFNVLYVLKLRKNLVSGPMLNKCGYKHVYESDKALKEMVNSMLSYSGLSEGFLGEAMSMACYLLNRVPNKRNKTTPYELWYKKRPNLSYLRVWDGRALVRLSDPKRKTLGEKGIDCIFVRYAKHSKACRDDHSDDVPSETPKPYKGKTVRKAKSFGSDFLLYFVEGSRDQVGSQYSYCYSIKGDSRTYNVAMQSLDSAFLKEAINNEIGSIMENNTCVLSDLPPAYRPLGYK